MSTEELKEKKWREDDGDLKEFMVSEVVKIRSLNNHGTLMTKVYFSSESRKLRHNTITFDN